MGPLEYNSAAEPALGLFEMKKRPWNPGGLHGRWNSSQV